MENTTVQQKFLGVLRYSLTLFLEKLKDSSPLEVQNPTSQTYCAILNGISYISCVLEEWNDDLVISFFICQCQAIVRSLYPWKRQGFSEIFGGYRKGTLAQKGLRKIAIYQWANFCMFYSNIFSSGISSPELVL